MKRMLADRPVLKSPLEKCFDLVRNFAEYLMQCLIGTYSRLSATPEAEFAVNVNGVSDLQIRVQVAVSVDIRSRQVFVWGLCPWEGARG